MAKRKARIDTDSMLGRWVTHAMKGNESLVVFNNDLAADMFADWWENYGSDAFDRWAQKNHKDYE